MKRILLLSPFFYPEPISTGKYNTHLAQMLLEQECSLKVICSYPFYPDWKVNSEYKELDGIKVVRGGKLISYPRKPIWRRIVLEIWFALFILRSLLFTRNQFDLVVLVIPPSLFALVALKLLPKRSKKVTVIHDLQSVYLSSNKSLLRNLINVLVKKVEKTVLSNSDLNIFLSESMYQRAVSDFKIRSIKYFISYPFVSIDTDFGKTHRIETLAETDKFHLVYSGALGEKQNPYELYLYCQRLCSEFSNLSVSFFSSGPIYEDLKNKESNPRLNFHDLVDEDELFALYLSSDAQLIPQIEGSNEGSLPSKLPNLLISGVPIIAIGEKNGELHNILNSFESTHFVDGWQYHKLKAEIKKAIISKQKSSNSHEIISSKRCGNPLMKNFRKEIVLKKIIE